MCGIAGLWDPNKRLSKEQAAKLAKKMAATLAHRGPDDKGHWQSAHGLCTLAHRRLSVIDTSSAGRQPFQSHDGRFHISFNGEIYNYRELSKELRKVEPTIQIRTATDTEVLLEAYRTYGKDLFPKLDGQYAFALYDSQEKELILARDPFGEKPLYYTEDSGGLVAFASELHALFELPFFDTTVELSALAEYLCFQYIGGRRTLYKNAQKLLPGTYKILPLKGKDYEEAHFEFNPIDETEPLKGDGDFEDSDFGAKSGHGSGGFHSTNGGGRRTLDDWADELEELLLRSIKNRLVADVPVGTFLSAGIDSSLVNALIRKKLDLPIMSFSAGFANWPGSEHRAAKETAHYLGCDHFEKLLQPQEADFLAKVPKLFDEPNGDTSCLPTYLLAQFARERVTVAISGDGGDELFGGYDRYVKTLEEATLAQMGMLPGWRPGQAYYSSRILYSPFPLLRQLFGFIPTKLRQHVVNLQHSITARNQRQLVNQLRKTDIENYLPGAVLAKVDRMSMRHALEVRTPFLHRDIAKFAERVPQQALIHNGIGKRILRHLAARYLPPKTAEAPKQGFGLPMHGWGKDELLQGAKDLLDNKESKLGSAFGLPNIQKFLEQQKKMDRPDIYPLWALTLLESYLQGRPNKTQGRHIKGNPIPLDKCALELENAEGLHLLAKESAPIFFFCTDDLASWCARLENGGTIISPLLFEQVANFEQLQLDWLDDTTKWWEDIDGENCVAYCLHPQGVDGFRFLIHAFEKMGFTKVIISPDNGATHFALPLRNSLGQRLHSLLTGFLLCFLGKPLTNQRWKFSESKIDGLAMEGPFFSMANGVYKTSVNELRAPKSERPYFPPEAHQLYENGRQLRGTSLSVKELTRRGIGQYAIWNGLVYVTTEDQSNPQDNGRSYSFLPKSDFNEFLRKVISRSYRLVTKLCLGYKVKLAPNAEGKAHLDPPLPKHLAGPRELSEPAIKSSSDDSVTLFENGRPLNSQVQNKGEVQELGCGRFAIEGSAIYLSSSNGRPFHESKNEYFLIEKTLWNRFLWAIISLLQWFFWYFNPSAKHYITEPFKKVAATAKVETNEGAATDAECDAGVCATGDAGAGAQNDHCQKRACYSARILPPPPPKEDASKELVLFEKGNSLKRVNKEELKEATKGSFYSQHEKFFIIPFDESDPNDRPNDFILCTPSTLNQRLLANLKWALKKVLIPLAPYFTKAVFRHDVGHCYTAISPYPIRRRNREESHLYYLFEDSLLLTGDRCLHDDIRTKGLGRFSVWNGQLFFTSSDNSSPNKNGRSYRLIKKNRLTRYLFDEVSFRRLLPQTLTEDQFFLRFSQWIEKYDKEPIAEPEGRPQRIVLFTTSLEAGGAERQWAYLARELDERGFAVTLLSYNDLKGKFAHYLPLLAHTQVETLSINDIFQGNFPLCQEDREPLVRASFIAQCFPEIGFQLRQLFHYFLHKKPHAVLCQLDSANVMGGISALLARVPNILLSFRNVNPTNFPRFYRDWYKKGYKALMKSDRIVLTGNSHYGNDDYAKWLSLKDTPAVIRNGVAPAFLAEKERLKEYRKELGLEPRQPVITGIFRFASEKRPMLFLAVAKAILQKRKEVAVLIVGDGPLRPEMEKWLEKEGLQDKIHLLGRRQDTNVILQLSTLCMLTSKVEGTPNVFLEAQMLKVPVVGANICGIPEAMAEGESGLLCKSDQVNEYVEHCLTIIDSPEKAEAMGNAGRKFVEENFSIKGMVETTLRSLKVPAPDKSAQSHQQDQIARPHHN